MGVIKALALDFDNFIALDPATGEGSEEIKERAWREVFPELDSRMLDNVIEQAKKDIEGGKGDRKDIALKVLKHLGYPETQSQSRCQLFDKLVQRGICDMSISPMAKTTLGKLSSKVPIFVNSATPLVSVLSSLSSLGILGFFKGIYGRPRTKLENLQRIIKAERITAGELLFGDDQESGRLVALEAGCQFVGMITRRNTLWHRPGLPFPTIRDLSGLLNLF